ncbi:UDP-N-acetylmuramate:L-alanyl-gamma-D-glutamyl-meso-diaminopimelate ligase [Acidihalobacter aeolianus]|uniref:UDP-N-acetylmuramate--L-alanyl-gamma-D-glutamyl-meso-2,6-diaminoheptandioate ligase n=1 Tax=Acidihalobacter aeolianus TaxID=2792603 RepID=A0A1D8K9R6_9GAMM|nr:UDP-N-acetylmuramate:L-alanyl-gamma-D-glutamyl-meso-diaminopimelate ligase [Acidihalobacter aeolianus]AOV17694.1 UDP-N-acetylmuramate:L-alanyl-gamma-D-glutamyl-meso-diaminopimelate ligase [Acidihalobacter aeolianus]
MHVHILGIGGTFMGGLAQLAKAAGHEVSGSDTQLYPPMSTQLEAAGIAVHEGYDPAQLDPAPDQVVVGNFMRRGVPAVEAMLDRGLDYTSGPQWLAEHVLHGRWVLAVAGTHGKTTTSSLLAHILQHAGLEPGFLIGGVPADFGVSARLGESPFFVVEADEYDTAFFDKRSKFVHYRPRTLLLNNLEYDHADIFPDLAAIQRQFHHLVRTVPGNGLIVRRGDDAALDEMLAMGCWTPVEPFTLDGGDGWSARLIAEDGSRFEVLHDNRPLGEIAWKLLGRHNVSNALGALLAARHAGVPLESGLEAVSSFGGVARRLQVVGDVAGVTLYDDFAHHPTAIATTLQGLRARSGRARIVAVLEPRSATMRMGVHRQTLGASLSQADRVFLYQPSDLGWSLREVAAELGERAAVLADLDGLEAALIGELRASDQVVFMSNGSFGGLPLRVRAALAERAESTA